jgi:hypothetical protein
MKMKMRAPQKCEPHKNLTFKSKSTTTLTLRIRLLAYKITKTIALKELHQRAHQVGAQVTIANTVDILPPQRPYERRKKQNR